MFTPIRRGVSGGQVKYIDALSTQNPIKQGEPWNLQ